MDVSVRELRNHTARVIAAVESGQRVVLTVHGRPVADIVPRQERAEARSTEALMTDLAELKVIWDEFRARGGTSDPADYDMWETTDDFPRRIDRWTAT